jgi:hypothetical protein
MSSTVALQVRNGEVARLQDVPQLPPAEHRDTVIRAVSDGARIAALFGHPLSDARVQLWAVLANDFAGTLTLVASEPLDRYRALTPDCPQAHAFEREIAEQWGVLPDGHPWLKPIRFHRSWRPESDAWGRAPGSPILPGVTDFFSMRGEEVHEVAVGPVHAAVIEPGHFRFQCHGETVFHLEISLGYQHRGVERALLGGPGLRSIHYAETLAGDTSVGHATAYCQALESLAGCAVPARAQALRGIALELERLANHTGDLGALAADVGYLPTARIVAGFAASG